MNSSQTTSALVGLALFLAAAGVVYTCRTPSPPPAPVISCDPDDAGACVGTCPKGETCGAVGKHGCACKPEAGSPFCGFTDAGSCGGPCPEGETCALVNPTTCACVAAR